MLLHGTVEKRKELFRLRERSNCEISHHQKLFNYPAFGWASGLFANMEYYNKYNS
jgi:hypothetical protein